MSHLHHRVREITNHYGELESLFGHSIMACTSCRAALLCTRLGSPTFGGSPNRQPIPNDGSTSHEGHAVHGIRRRRGTTTSR
jgi:hypothetical protein